MHMMKISILAVQSLVAVDVVAAESHLVKAGFALTDATCWDEQSGFPDAATDYCDFGNSVQLKIGSSAVTFPGRALKIGQASGVRPYVALTGGSRSEFTGSGGLVFGGCDIDCWSTSCDVFAGKVQVAATKQNPVRIVAVNQTASDAVANVQFEDGTFSGEAGACCHAYIKDAEWTSGASSRMMVRILSDTSAYLGCFKVSAYKNEAMPSTEKCAVLQLGRFPFGGTVELSKGSMLEAHYADSTVDIARLEAKEGASLVFLWNTDSGTGATYRVRSGLTVQAPVLVRPSSRNKYDKTKGFRHALLKAPSGVKLNSSDWVFAKRDLPNVELVVADDDDGLSTLWAVARPVVSMKADDQSGKTGSFAYDSGAPTNNWEDGAYPTDGFDYWNPGYKVRPPSGKTLEVEFGGHSLSLRAAYPQKPLVHELRCKKITVDDLWVDPSWGDIVFDNYAGVASSVAGKMHISPKTEGYGLRIYAYNSNETVLESDITGDGAIILQQLNTTKGALTLTGENANWRGRLVVEASQNSGTADVCFYEGANMGGPLSSFAFNAIDLGKSGRLVSLGEEAALDEPTRGVYVRDGGSVFVDTGRALTLCERVTYDGALRKQGGGLLRLGGSAPLFTSSHVGTPVTEKNVLRIDGGSLMPLSSEAFEGLSVRFAAGTRIVLRHPDDAGVSVARYGMALTNELSSIDIADAHLPVSFAETASKRSGLSAICTVRSDMAPPLRGKFKLIPFSTFGDRFSAQVVEQENDDGTVTFAVKFSKGLVLLLK